jgi:transposase-like protein
VPLVDCPRCGRQYAAGKGLEVHMRSHTRPRYRCPLCGHVRVDLVKHAETKHDPLALLAALLSEGMVAEVHE